MFNRKYNKLNEEYIRLKNDYSALQRNYDKLYDDFNKFKNIALFSIKAGDNIIYNIITYTIGQGYNNASVNKDIYYRNTVKEIYHDENLIIFNDDSIHKITEINILKVMKA